MHDAAQVIQAFSLKLLHRRSVFQVRHEEKAAGVTGVAAAAYLSKVRVHALTSDHVAPSMIIAGCCLTGRYI